MTEHTEEQQISVTLRDYEVTKDTSDDIYLISSSLEGSQTNAEIPGVSLLDFNLIYANNETNKQANNYRSPPPADTPSLPDTTEEPPPSPTPSPTTPEAPHPNPSHPYLIIPVEKLQRVVNNYMVSSSLCDNNKMQLVQGRQIGLTTRFAVVCTFCEKKLFDKTKSLRYLRNKKNNQPKHNREERKKVEKTRNRITYTQRVVKKYEKSQNEGEVDPVYVENETNNKVKNKKRNQYEQRSMMAYQLNVRAMLSAFMNGTGGADITRTLTLMGLGGKGFERSFYRHSRFMHEIIMRVTRRLIREGLLEEISASVRNMIEEREIGTLEGEVILSKIKKNELNDIETMNLQLPIAVSYDMGWQKRAGGRVYDSLSGHGYFIGCRTGKVVAMGVKKKRCRTCLMYNEDGAIMPPHNCNVNHEGSSGSMEGDLCLDLLNLINSETDEKVFVSHLVTDDDTTLRANCANENKGGKLPNNIKQPHFLADPSHRIKVMAKPIFAMVTNNKDQSKLKMIDALRIKKYIGCYILQNRNKDFNTFVRNASAPIEHMFNNHAFCDSSWCPSKEMNEKVHKLLSSKLCSEVRLLRILEQTMISN